MSKLSDNLPPDIAELFDKPGHEWSPEERHRVWQWLAEDPEAAKRLQDIAQKHLRRPQSMQATGMAATDARHLNLQLLRDAYRHIFLRSTAVLRVQDLGRLRDKQHQPPKAEALATFLRECLQEEMRQRLDQHWP